MTHFYFAILDLVEIDLRVMSPTLHVIILTANISTLCVIIYCIEELNFLKKIKPQYYKFSLVCLKCRM